MRNPQVWHHSAFMFCPEAGNGETDTWFCSLNSFVHLSADAFAIILKGLSGDNVLCGAEGCTPSAGAVLRAVILSQGVYPDLPSPHSCWTSHSPVGLDKKKHRKLAGSEKRACMVSIPPCFLSTFTSVWLKRGFLWSICQESSLAIGSKSHSTRSSFGPWDLLSQGSVSKC